VLEHDEGKYNRTTSLNGLITYIVYHISPLFTTSKGADFIMSKLKKRTDGRYSVTSTINGKRKYFYGRTRTEAQEKCDAYEKQSDNIANFNADITIAEWAPE
jgi:hypothetical protein